MTTVCKFATLTIMMFAVSVWGFSQRVSTKTPATATQNLVRGVIGPAGSNASWANYSVFNAIPDHQHHHRLLLRVHGWNHGRH
jgi:hypothetical protein